MPPKPPHTPLPESIDDWLRSQPRAESQAEFDARMSLLAAMIRDTKPFVEPPIDDEDTHPMTFDTIAIERIDDPDAA